MVSYKSQDPAVKPNRAVVDQGPSLRCDPPTSLTRDIIAKSPVYVWDGEQIMGVHLEMKHFASNGSDAYTMESYGAAVSTIRDKDMAWSGNPNGIQEACPEAWAAISQWRS